MISLRYGHCDGHTDVCYTDSSRNFITCGGEGDVRVWEDINDTDQKDLCIGDKAWAVCHKGKTLYVATDKNIVQAYTFPDLELDGIITRFTAPVTQIDISLDEKKLAAGSCNMDIHIVDIDTMEKKILSGHMAPILSISLDPQLSFLVSSSCDGTVRVWNINTCEIVHQWDSLVEKSNSFERAPSLCRLHFQPIHGHFVAIPVQNNINIYARETWSTVKTINHSASNSTFSVVRYSKCGKYIAGGTVKGEVYIFSVSTEKVINETSDKNNHAITAISWHSKSTGVIFCNVNGQIGELLASSGSTCDEEPVEAQDLADIPLGVPDFEDDDDDDNVISLEKIKAASGFGHERITSSPIKTEDKDDKDSLISDKFHKYEPKVPFAELEEAFQPSSTPLHLQERFLLWNNVGIVRGFSREDGVDELDIEFHDTTLHHGFRMSNTPGYTMAALTPQALVLASPRLGEISSKLSCVLLKAWDGQKEWEANFVTEEAIGLAAGRNWIAVVTDRLFLRIYSVDGTQTDLLSIPGPLVSLSGQADQLSVYFHSAQGREKDQYISFMQVIVNADSKLGTVKTVSPLPITPTSTVKWVGFSDEGAPSTLDSEGFLRLLYNRQWRPICSLEDRVKGKFDHYFVLGLSEKSHTIRCILCKGAYYPPVVPKPIVNEIDWQMPLSDLDTDKGKLEEELLRAVITVPNLQLSQYEDDSEAKNSVEKTISVSVMKLFALACRTGLECRAVSLCESMPSIDVVKLACKYAAKLGRHQLANRVSDVVARMSEEENNRIMKEREDDCQMEEDNEKMSSSSSRHHHEGSQDIFADHNDTSYKQTSKLSDKENLIMKMRKKKLTADNPDPKPNILEGQKRFSRNPFKKSQPEEEEDSKESPSTPRPNYMDWFNQNKSSIQAEHPLLKDSELAIVGMKKYRQSHNSTKGESISSSSSSPLSSNKEFDKGALREEETDSKKRKLSDIMNESIKKKPFVAEQKSSPADKKITPSEKKPLSAASKLKNFSFVKKT